MNRQPGPGDVGETVREAEELARRIVRRRLRKGLGAYYLVWSTYAASAGLLYSIVQNLSPGEPLRSLAFMAILLAYMAYTWVIFYRAFSKRELLSGYQRRLWSRLRYALVAAAVTAAVGAWEYLLFLLHSVLYDEVSAAAYSSIITVQIYYIARGTGNVKYYDYLAIASLPVSLLLGPLYYALYYVYSFFWVYAGARSIEDSYEED